MASLFESTEPSFKIDKATYDKKVPSLRKGLLDAQFDIAATKWFEIVIVGGGIDDAGPVNFGGRYSDRYASTDWI